MKKIVNSILILTALFMSGCSIFKKNCNCPKVYYKTYPSK